MGIIENLKRRLSDAREIASNALVDADIQKSRIEICNSCEFLSAVRNCKKCGCLVDMKSRLAIASCPLKKW